ncbi:hypothetical protein TREMEDRAFT_63402 [Tremella mesenterica DSM 1558]|uniref:uncharacterized protein n=1 Tax=Tremella mesenterica (strain ATCC 24925 / CBS 8224 / DSM 1558 / NBRC 9311 / NRRL Y-6157 / RJB 2259-6 / UBC 559-6) TaxID=578456 RepID=UPI0003F4935F|nr:uncharacterized protein TREMEDRAFT_63402 [Tremella mesenterica DSM 1558]EIW68235.1 hypothetical protein TREMEDRAFT_63402 [Tremella mesenterica DSM 1558]
MDHRTNPYARKLVTVSRYADIYSHSFAWSIAKLSDQGMDLKAELLKAQSTFALISSDINERLYQSGYKPHPEPPIPNSNTEWSRQLPEVETALRNFCTEQWDDEKHTLTHELPRAVEEWDNHLKKSLKSFKNPDLTSGPSLSSSEVPTNEHISNLMDIRQNPIARQLRTLYSALKVISCPSDQPLDDTHRLYRNMLGRLALRQMEVIEQGLKPRSFAFDPNDVDEMSLPEARGVTYDFMKRYGTDPELIATSLPPSIMNNFKVLDSNERGENLEQEFGGEYMGRITDSAHADNLTMSAIVKHLIPDHNKSKDMRDMSERFTPVW